MIRYKLLFIENSQLRMAVPFDADDDRAAMEYVAQRRWGRACELWSADRLVQRFSDKRSEDA
jgi:hypothetical protein